MARCFSRCSNSANSAAQTTARTFPEGGARGRGQVEKSPSAEFPGMPGTHPFHQRERPRAADITLPWMTGGFGPTSCGRDDFEKSGSRCPKVTRPHCLKVTQQM
jgi:hypothetical protein